MAIRTKSWFTDFAYDISTYNYWRRHGSGGLSPSVYRKGPGSIQGQSMRNLWWTDIHTDCFFAHYHSTNAPDIFVHSCITELYLYLASVSVVLLSYITHLVVLVRRYGYNLSNSHTQTSPKTHSGQSGWRKIVMWIIINETRISAVPSQSSVTWKNSRGKSMTK
jgi:hypothetical protein